MTGELRITMAAWKSAIASWTLVVLSTGASAADGVVRIGDVRFHGDIHADKDISAVCRFGKLLIIGADEAKQNGENLIQVLRPSGSDKSSYKVDRNVSLGGSGEMDIEGIACGDGVVYMVGSHSRKRKTVKEKEFTSKKNRGRLATVEKEKTRHVLHRVTLAPDGSRKSIVTVSLTDAIKKNDVLKRFLKIPSKENGVDIEGLAFDGKHLYAGFRGPVLRGNFVPVLRFRFHQDPDKIKAKLLFVNLNGRGIRGMTRVSKGFLIIAGPVGDGPGSYQLYHWNGEDCVPGTDRPKSTENCWLIGDLPTKPGEKAEGITILKETEGTFEVLVVHDGVKGGAPVKYSAKKRR